jgi:hypothetical protein
MGSVLKQFAAEKIPATLFDPRVGIFNQTFAVAIEVPNY